MDDESLPPPLRGSNIAVGGEVERLDGRNLSYLEFVRRFLVPNRPVVLTGLMDDSDSPWRACADWVTADGRPNLPFFSAHFGNSIVQVAECSKREFTDQKRLEMSLADYINYWLEISAKKSKVSKCIGDDDSLLYLKDWHFVKEYPDYIAYNTPIFFIDDWLNLHLDSHSLHRDSDISRHKNEVNCADYCFVYMGPKAPVGHQFITSMMMFLQQNFLDLRGQIGSNAFRNKMKLFLSLVGGIIKSIIWTEVTRQRINVLLRGVPLHLWCTETIVAMVASFATLCDVIFPSLDIGDLSKIQVLISVTTEKTIPVVIHLKDGGYTYEVWLEMLKNNRSWSEIVAGSFRPATERRTTTQSTVQKNRADDAIVIPRILASNNEGNSIQLIVRSLVKHLPAHQSDEKSNTQREGKGMKSAEISLMDLLIQAEENKKGKEDLHHKNQKGKEDLHHKNQKGKKDLSQVIQSENKKGKEDLHHKNKEGKEDLPQVVQEENKKGKEVLVVIDTYEGISDTLEGGIGLATPHSNQRVEGEYRLNTPTTSSIWGASEVRARICFDSSDDEVEGPNFEEGAVQNESPSAALQVTKWQEESCDTLRTRDAINLQEMDLVAEAIHAKRRPGRSKTRAQGPLGVSTRSMSTGAQTVHK